MGEPEDVEGNCNARLFIGDNYGDNHATMRCQLKPGHDGQHCETYHQGWRGGTVTVCWERDERDELNGSDEEEPETETDASATVTEKP